MGCRIGITTDLERRKGEWEQEHPDMRNWQIIAGPFDTQEEAQEKETELASRYGCVSHPGGEEPDTPNPIWYVYYFEYG